MTRFWKPRLREDIVCLPETPVLIQVNDLVRKTVQTEAYALNLGELHDSRFGLYS
jgi:hypothetical protein